MPCQPLQQCLPPGQSAGSAEPYVRLSCNEGEARRGEAILIRGLDSVRSAYIHKKQCFPACSLFPEALHGQPGLSEEKGKAMDQLQLSQKVGYEVTGRLYLGHMH